MCIRDSSYIVLLCWTHTRPTIPYHTIPYHTIPYRARNTLHRVIYEKGAKIYQTTNTYRVPQKKWDLRNSTFWGLSRPIAAYIMSWHTKTGYQGMSRYYIKRFCAPTVHPIATTRPIKGATSWALVYIEGLRRAGCTVGTPKRFL